MSNSKQKNSNWLMPAFDSTSVKDKQVKHNNSHLLEKSRNDGLHIMHNFPKGRNVSNLSDLLATCEPKTPSELAVSRQKQQEISDWLAHKVKRGYPAALVLSGPSGSGKTIAIRLLAKEHGFDVIEWITPIDQAMDENNRITRQGERFEDFLIRATRYSSVFSNHSRRLLLVKDFPNVYIDDMESFFSLLKKYFEIGKEPIVLICTETGNSKLLQTLLAQHIREKFGIDLINVNAVTQAAMKNALKRVSGILNATAGHIMHVSQHKIDEILSNSVGDIRSALLNLVFISLKAPDEALNISCTIREESLGLLHGIGRVINPKRVQEGDSWKFVHDPDEIAAYFQSQASIFLNFLHENYINTMRGIEEVDVAANVLSIADVLNSEWRDHNLTKVTLSFCIRGVMVTNEKPVAGWNPVRKPQTNRTEMHRCLGTTEIRWYESVIKPNQSSKTEQLECGVDGIVE